MKHKHVTCIQKTRQSTEIDTEMTQMFKLVHKDFDVPDTNIFKYSQQIYVMMNKTHFLKKKNIFVFIF